MAAHARVHVQGCGLWSWVLVLGRGVSIWGLGVRVTWLHLSLSIRRPVCVYVRMYARMYVCMCVCMYVYLASHAPQHPSASGRILPTATQLVPRPPLEARVRCSTAPCPGHVCVCVCVQIYIHIYDCSPSITLYLHEVYMYIHTYYTARRCPTAPCPGPRAMSSRYAAQQTPRDQQAQRARNRGVVHRAPRITHSSPSSPAARRQRRRTP